jgi:hypothetical protein
MRAAMVIHCEYAGQPFEAQPSASFTVDSLTRTCEPPNILYVCGEEVLVLPNAPDDHTEGGASAERIFSAALRNMIKMSR